MAITAVFSTNQVVGNPQNIVLVDASTGTDVLATERRVYVVNAAGQYLTENYTVSDSIAYTAFPLADGATITLENILSVDTAAYITLTYNDVSGNVRATVTNLVGFTMYNMTFYYTLTQDQAQQNQPPPMIMQDSNYYTNKGILITEIDSGNNAIELGADITSAQACYDRATFLVANQNTYF